MFEFDHLKLSWDFFPLPVLLEHDWLLDRRDQDEGDLFLSVVKDGIDFGDGEVTFDESHRQRNEYKLWALNEDAAFVVPNRVRHVEVRPDEPWT